VARGKPHAFSESDWLEGLCQCDNATAGGAAHRWQLIPWPVAIEGSIDHKLAAVEAATEAGLAENGLSAADGSGSWQDGRVGRVTRRSESGVRPPSQRHRPPSHCRMVQPSFSLLSLWICIFPSRVVAIDTPV
jgi:hypothetical protein